MKSQANIKDIEVLNTTSKELKNINNISIEISNKLRLKAKKLFEECKNERKNSKRLLDLAILDENNKRSIMLAAQAGLPETYSWYCQAKATYEQAVAKRKRMEKRYKMSCECEKNSQDSLNETINRLKSELGELNSFVLSGGRRLKIAYNNQREYLILKSEINQQSIEEYENEFKDSELITPNMIRNRLTLSEAQIKLMMLEEYQNNENFKNKIEKYSEEMKSDEKGTELKIKKNLSGEIGEMIVKKAFIPFGDSVETQHVTQLEEGSYTKTDLILKDLKKPLIMGRGQGAGVKPGNDIAIEVKTGTKEYIRNQKDHMLKQIKGHANSKMSLIICSRDLNVLADDINKEFRNEFKDNGTRIYAMLNTKEEIDNACINFVKNR